MSLDTTKSLCRT